MRPVVKASVPCLEPPYWALAERSLFAILDDGWRRFEECFTRSDGSLRYDDVLRSRDGADDFFEPFFNWPQLYLLGGAPDLLGASERHWHGIATQLTDLGMFRDEFEIGYDWFHQGESLLFLYFLTMADPQTWTGRATRFADLYVDPAAGNYDAERQIVKAPHNGSGGARAGIADTPSYPWTASEAAQYGYPLDWLGERAGDATDDPRVGQLMQTSLGRGDVVGNLSIGGLVLNAYLASGEKRYATWLSEYIGAWQERAASNDGLIPDNVGLDGVVGSQLDGRWYGGHYGWTWPHGMYSLGQATLVGAMAAALATQDDHYLNLPRELLDTVIEQGRQMRFADSDSSIKARWRAHLGPAVDADTLLIPYRHSDRGWFDWNPIQTSVPMALWHHTADEADRKRLDDLRAASGYDWSVVRPFRDKEEAGHEEPWYAYLSGDNPSYPEVILQAAHAQTRRRLALIEQHADDDVTEEHIHLWQNLNPVVTEALVQLTWGGPQVVYNGGAAQARVRYFDVESRRPGLPMDVAALVSSIDPESTVVTLINLGATAGRSLVLQAGAFAEHHIRTLRYGRGDPRWTGHDTEYVHHQAEVENVTLAGDGPWVQIDLPAGTQITLELELEMNVEQPSYRDPWTDRPALDEGI